ncbi:acyl-CoA--sterol O-acyltransferase 1 [Manihot esculenta]|uniref:acyl-CoA--sterol O-acyltransferase 1 n=1 Tax=Manihot esculenta TaxID=3983 RepID=UPI001CC3C5A7|nr:acyl-CoA--sterol O-acyltransferase 1 [Manihot esculenta]
MEELYNFFKVWLSVLASLIYCYAIGTMVPKGSARFFCLLPILCLFLLLPLNLSSIHFRGMTAFFIAWLVNFKLLLYAFDKGPLSSSYDNNPSISFSRFLPVACFPIKIKRESHPNGDKPNPVRTKVQKSMTNYAVKGLLLAMVVRVYNYREFIHPNVILLLYFLHMYFFLELILAMVGVMARALLGLELEPQFNEPYLSTSLQDFWGRRWNLMVTSILRPTAYEPFLRISASVIGRRWAPIPAIFGTFVVSAVMHELMFYYVCLEKPTWEITWFFLLHGVCLMVEVALKKAVAGKWSLSRLISTPLTVGFLLATGLWLFFPQLLRCKVDVRAFEEYSALSAFLKNVGRASSSMFGSFNRSINWSIVNTIKS